MPDYLTIRPPAMDTGVLGQVDPPAADELLKMQQSPYVLRAVGGTITRIGAEKSTLPGDPTSHPQAVRAFKHSDAAIYVRQSQTLCKSTDGGRTWTSKPIPVVPQVFTDTGDGSFVGVHAWSDQPVARVYTSRDEASTWEETGTIELPSGFPGGGVCGVLILRDGALLCDVQVENAKYVSSEHTQAQEMLLDSGICRLLAYRSTDGGRTWEPPSQIVDFSGEGGITVLASGHLLAVKRHQRGLLPRESLDLLESLGVNEVFARIGVPPNRLYKNVALADSVDHGRTWTNQRLLTTVFGQCYGYPAAQTDGTVAVVHDTRYGPGPQSSRAMISRDEGRTWQNEVYYLLHGRTASGYTSSVVLDDDTILTVGGTSDYAGGNQKSWHNWIGQTQVTAIRWRPQR